MLSTEPDWQALAIPRLPLPVGLPRLALGLCGEAWVSFGELLYAAPPHSCPKGPRASGPCGVSVVCACTSPHQPFALGQEHCSGQLLSRVGLSRMDFLLIKESDA